MFSPYHSPWLEHCAIVSMPHHDEKEPELIHLVLGGRMSCSLGNHCLWFITEYWETKQQEPTKTYQSW